VLNTLPKRKTGGTTKVQETTNSKARVKGKGRIRKETEKHNRANPGGWGAPLEGPMHEKKSEKRGEKGGPSDSTERGPRGKLTRKTGGLGGWKDRLQNGKHTNSFAPEANIVTAQ